MAQDTAAWKALQAHFDGIGSKLNMRELFVADPARFAKFRLEHAALKHCQHEELAIESNTCLQSINLISAVCGLD